MTNAYNLSTTQTLILANEMVFWMSHAARTDSNGLSVCMSFSMNVFHIIIVHSSADGKKCSGTHCWAKVVQ